MKIVCTVNRDQHTLEVHPGELLRTALRRLHYYSVKHGDETGESGADAVLLTFTPDQPKSYRLVNSGLLLAAQADGAFIVTAEGLSGPRDHELHPLQEQFVHCGAIQCGYCTPAQLLAAKKLLDENPNPSEHEVRTAIAGVLCRCTGYLKPVEAVLRAVAQMRSHDVVLLDEQLAMEAADFSVQYGLAMADAIVYATARSLDAALVTSDAHFADLPNVTYVPKPTPGMA